MTQHRLGRTSRRPENAGQAAHRSGLLLVKDLVYNSLVAVGGPRAAQLAERTTDYLRQRQLQVKEQPPTILLDRRAETNRQRKLCLFSHFDQHGLVDDYVVYYLQALAQAGFDIHLISTSPFLGPEQVERLRPLCLSVILKENVGLDFCSWKLALRLYPEFQEYDELLLANDSVYGPTFDLAEMLRTMDEKNCDAWGITDSWALQYHLQSYFVLLKRPVFTSAYFANFFDSVLPLGDKLKIIERYEMGLTRVILEHGHTIDAYCTFRALYRANYDTRTRLARRYGHPHETNPTVFFWKQLIEQKRCPFVKISVLREDLMQESEPNKLEALFKAAELPYPTALIVDHQKRVSCGNFP